MVLTAYRGESHISHASCHDDNRLNLWIVNQPQSTFMTAVVKLSLHSNRNPNPCHHCSIFISCSLFIYSTSNLPNLTFHPRTQQSSAHLSPYPYCHSSMIALCQLTAWLAFSLSCCEWKSSSGVSCHPVMPHHLSPSCASHPKTFIYNFPSGGCKSWQVFCFFTILMFRRKVWFWN